MQSRASSNLCGSLLRCTQLVFSKVSVVWLRSYHPQEVLESDSMVKVVPLADNTEAWRGYAQQADQSVPSANCEGLCAAQARKTNVSTVLNGRCIYQWMSSAQTKKLSKLIDDSQE
eukprot:scaffold196335_cov18-Prasinocladus_malaysianus.AAC.1